MELTGDAVEKAVHQFYFVPDNQVQAHEWLKIAQMSSEAWNFCWELMQPQKSQEVQFFGANTLSIKISKFWSELTEDQYPELKIKLIKHIITYISYGPNIMLTRLCVALSSYVIHTSASSWESAVIDIINIFQAGNLPEVSAEKSTSFLMQFLTILPEEFQTVILPQSYRNIVRTRLQTNTDSVLAVILQTLMKSSDISLSLQALKSFKSWIVFGISLPDCPLLIDITFNLVPVKELSETACDVILNIVNHPESHKYPSSLLKLFEKILQLEPILTSAVQEKDMDMCNALCNLFTIFGETHSRLLLESFLKDETIKDHVLRLVKIILACTGAAGQYPIDETFSSLTFSFWYNLQDEIISSERDDVKIYMNYFVSVFETLVDVLLQKLMSPKVKKYPTWNSDDIEQFRCYHQDIGDTLMYCYNLLRSRMLARLLSHLNNILMNSNQNNEEVQQALEACLFAFQSVAESIEADENIYIPQFISQLTKIPCHNNSYVISSILDALGAYAEWMNGNPTALPQIIPLIIMGLNESGAATSATIALKEIARDCQVHTRPFAEQLLTICEEVFRRRSLKHQEEIRLMCSIGYIASLLPEDMIMIYLNNLLAPFYQEVQKLCQEQELTPVVQTILISRFTLLSMLFNTLNTKLKDEAKDGMVAPKLSTIQPILLVLQRFLPLLRDVVSRWPNCVPLMDCICELIRRALTNLLDDALPVLENVLQLLNVIYDSSASVAALGLFKLVAIIFFDNEQQKLNVQNSLMLIIDKTMSLGQVGGLSNHSDVAEAFCQLLANLMKKRPVYFEHNQINVLLLFQYGVAVLDIPEAHAVKAASLFLVNFINQSREFPPMLNVINNYGDVLLLQTLKCIGGSSPRGVMDSMTDVLTIMLKKYFDNTCRWLHSSMAQDNFPSNHVDKQQKEMFVKAALRDYSNKRKLQELVKTFSLSCRGLIGTEYASQILPSL